MSHVRCMLLLLALSAGGCGGGGAKPGAQEPADPSSSDSGLRLTYKVEAGSAGAVATTMQKRFDSLRVAGVTGVTARADGARVVVEFAEPREDLVDRIRGVASRQGKMSFHVVDDDAEPMRALAKHVDENQAAIDLKISTDETTWQDPSSGAARRDVSIVAEDRDAIFTEAEGRRIGCWRPGMPIRGGGKVSCRVTGRETIERYIADVAAAGGPKIPEDRELIFQKASRTEWRTYFVERGDALTGGAIATAEVHEGDDGSQHTMIVFDDAGKRSFAEKTAAQVGGKLVILLDGEVLTAPIVEAPIADGRYIFPPVSRRAAEDLAAVLAFPLPAPVKEDTGDKPAAPGTAEENPLAF
jgi:preprotein translocase subunit SecD